MIELIHIFPHFVWWVIIQLVPQSSKFTPYVLDLLSWVW